MVPAPFEHLDNAIGQHDEFESVVVSERTWPTQGITVQHRILGTLTAVQWRNCRMGLYGLRGFPEFRAIRRHRWNGLHVQVDPVVSPHSRQVARIEWMSLHLVFNSGGRDMTVVLAPRASLPTRSGRNFGYFCSGLFSDDELLSRKRARNRSTRSY